MALFDRMGGLLGNLGDYGFGLPSNIGGLVADEDRDAINKRALLSGLISAGLTYAATPKNLNAGSALPYLGRAGLAGFGASQDVVDRALNTAYRNKILTARDDSDKLYTVDGALVDKTGKVVYPGTPKQEKLPTSAEEYNLATKDPAYMKFLREKWDAENKALKASAQVEESAYKYGTPQQSISVNAGGKTYYFKDQNSANLFRQKAGIK
jgi:YHS domain-containing protein